MVQLQVKDLEGAWSLPVIKTLDTGNVNLPPLVDANPQSANSDANIPVVVTSDDLGEGDLDHTNYYWSKYTSKPTGAWTTRTTKSFTTTLTTEGTWYLHMEAFDASGQSFYIYRGPYTLIKNQAPTVSISASPAIIYENDDVTIRMIPVDPDGDATQLSLQSSKDGGAWTTIFTKSGCISSQAQSYTLQNVASGSYRLRVVATDPSGLNASAETIFSTNLLDITGQVRHTDLWDAHRQQYNNAKSGSANSPRAYDEFFPGERFMLVADTSVIDASRPDLYAQMVTCALIDTSYSDNMASSNRRRWTGDIWDEDMMKWSDKSLNFLFTVTYSNGAIRADTVEVNIVYDEYWRLHMKF